MISVRSGTGCKKDLEQVITELSIKNLVRFLVASTGQETDAPVNVRYYTGTFQLREGLLLQLIDV